MEQLAAGEITADEADAQLGAADDDTRPTSRVSAGLSGGGHIEVRGDAIDVPRLEGPSRCTITEDGDGYHVHGQVGDDAVLLVPADADLRLHLNGASAAIGGVRGPIDAVINAGDVDIDCALEEGLSKLHLNAGDLHLRFGTRSDVRVRVLAPTAVEAGDGFDKTDRGEWALGQGRALVEIDGNLGTIFLEAE